MRTPRKPPPLPPKYPQLAKLRLAWRDPRFLPLWVAGGIFLVVAGALMWLAKPDTRIVKALTIQPQDAMLRVGEKQQFVATLSFTDGTSEIVTDAAQWDVADAQVAVEAESAGEIAALGEGVSKVRAIYLNTTSDTSLAVIAKSAQRLECVEIGFAGEDKKDFKELIATVSGSFATDGKDRGTLFSLSEQVVAFLFVKRSACAQEVTLRQTTPAGKLISEKRIRLVGKETDSKSLDVRLGRLSRIGLRIRPLGECSRKVAYELGDASNRSKLSPCTE